MKKSKLTLLFTVSTLMLASCGETNSSVSESPIDSVTSSETSSKGNASSSSKPSSNSSSKEDKSSESSSKEEITSSSSKEVVSSSSEEVTSSSEDEVNSSSSEENKSSSEEEISSSSEEEGSSSSEDQTSSSSEESSSSEDQSSSSSEDQSSSSSEDSSSEEEINHYTVSFDSMGGSEVETQTIEEGGKATRPTDPTKDDYTFGGWFLSSSYKKEFDFETPITTDYILFAKWDAKGGTVDPDPDPVTPSLTLVDYWIAGNFCSWSKDGAIQMNTNPNGNDLAMKLNVEIEAGKAFKVTNFNDWYGYNDSLSSVSTIDKDGNIVINETGTYDIYLNQYYQVWVQKSA